MIMSIKGIDVSTHQGTILWEHVAKSDIEFAMLRSSYGYCSDDSQIDKFFEINYKACKKYNIPCGAYHYSYARNKEQAIKEANYMLKAINGKIFEYPIAFDIEEPKILNKLTRNEITEIIKGFCETIENAGYYVCVYSSKSRIESFEKIITDRYDIWLAQWDVVEPTTTKSYGIWQYTSKGTVQGILGRVDLNYCYKDYPKIMKHNGLNGFTKKETVKQETPQEETNIIINADGGVTLNKCKYYESATAKEPVKNSKGVKLLTGKYYLYDGKKHTNNRYRITNKKTNCGKKPIGKYVTGYIEIGVKYE